MNVRRQIQPTAAAVLIGLSLSLQAAGPAAAQEVPTGAARIIEKVQTRIFISKASLLFHVADIQANLDEQFGGE